VKLPVEEWLETQDFEKNIGDLFRESIICYKASAYRAALLFSYLGFQSVVKDRVIKAERPANIHERAWEAIKKNLRKEDGWDTEVNECIKKNDENKRIFIISEDLRQQAIYWKNRRNDCAHSKPNMIEASHVEAFWLFLKSNLAKFVVNGSKDSLLQKIERHFNPNYTSEDEDFIHLVNEVPNAILVDDLEEFMKEINQTFNDNEMIYPFIADRSMKFWSELIKLDSPVSDKAIAFIKSNEELQIQFLGDYPEHVSAFYYNDSSGVRNLWREKLNDVGYKKLIIFTALLRNGLITEDKEEALDHTVRKIGNSKPQDSDIPYLLEHGYFSKYKELVFREDFPLINQFDWGNSSEGSIGKHLDIIGLDEVIVKKLDETFWHTPFPFKMRDALEKYFCESEDKKRKYIEICENLEIEPTKNLGF
jgi:hypothetical protein